MLPLWRYDVNDFQKRWVFFFLFCIFLHKNNTKQHDFNTFGKLREGATNIVSWENSPKKVGTYPKREIDTERLQKINNRLQRNYKKSDMDYKVDQYTTKFTHRLQKTTKVGHRLQSLLIDYKRLQRLDIDYKVYQ